MKYEIEINSEIDVVRAMRELAEVLEVLILTREKK